MGLLLKETQQQGYSKRATPPLSGKLKIAWVDLCTLDNALGYISTSHFMRGTTINIVYNTFISTLQTVVAAETQINVSRSLSNMTSVFVSLDTAFTGDRLTCYDRCWKSPTAVVGQTGYLKHTEERFSHFQLQVGAELFPEHPVETHAEAFCSLCEALGIQANNLHSIDIDGT